MIKNERQYKITKSQLSKLEAALPISPTQNLPPKLRKAAVAGIQSQIDDLRAELQEYDALKSNQIDQLHLLSLTGLGELLVKTRIARGYTQAQLASKLNLKHQQIQKYEASGYASASLHRISDIMQALNIDIRAQIELQ